MLAASARSVFGNLSISIFPVVRASQTKLEFGSASEGRSSRCFELTNVKFAGLLLCLSVGEINFKNIEHDELFSNYI